MKNAISTQMKILSMKQCRDIFQPLINTFLFDS